MSPVSCFLNVILFGLLPVTKCLQCYQCSNVTSTAGCMSTVTCQRGQICYTKSRAVGVNQTLTFDLGCKNESECLPVITNGLVGKAVTNQNDCEQCCRLDKCNRNLCLARTDGQWSTWSNWQACSATCQGGLQTRRRACDNPAPLNFGQDCTGNHVEIRHCNIIACGDSSSSSGSQDGQWSTWSDWGTCSATCLGGLKTRRRTCDNTMQLARGHACVGNNEDYQLCNNIECRNHSNEVFGNKGMPVSFRATIISNLSGYIGRTLIFTKTAINNGGGYNNATGIFTAPEDGLYSFVVQICMYNKAYNYVRIVKDGNIESSAQFYDEHAISCYSTSALLPMDTGNRVWVTISGEKGPVQTTNLINSFQGTKIGG